MSSPLHLRRIVRDSLGVEVRRTSPQGEVRFRKCRAATRSLKLELEGWPPLQSTSHQGSTRVSTVERPTPPGEPPEPLTSMRSVPVRARRGLSLVHPSGEVMSVDDDAIPTLDELSPRGREIAVAYLESGLVAGIQLGQRLCADTGCAEPSARAS